MSECLEEIQDYIYGIAKFTSKNSLEHTRMYLKELGNPQEDFKCIHVAGSNGKGSTCSFIYHILMEAGYSTGLFISPHLVDIRERFCINGEWCSKESYVKAFEIVKAVADRLVEEGVPHPTFFEFLFLMGMLIFKEAGVHFVVLETGLGGRLDATNSIEDPLISVITSISLEHTEYLGDTIEAIAGEKAGIIKPGVPVVYDAGNSDAAKVIEEVCIKNGSDSWPISKNSCNIININNKFIEFNMPNLYDDKKVFCDTARICNVRDRKTDFVWKNPFPAEYQISNAALAIRAAQVLDRSYEDINISDEIIRDGLMKTTWSGRMECVSEGVYFDGAHNADGIKVFCDAVNALTREDAENPVLLFAMLSDKDYTTAIYNLSENVKWDRVILTQIPEKRCLAAKELAEVFAFETDIIEDYKSAYKRAMEYRKPGQKLFVAGSLYFIGMLKSM